MLEVQDPKAKQLMQVAQIGGTVVVGAAALVVIMVAGTSLVVAGGIGLAGLVLINFVLPVGARALAIARQKAYTSLAENFSEETLKDDEVKEGQRIQQMETEYINARAAMESASQEIRQQLSKANPDQAQVMQNQLDAMSQVVLNAEAALKERKADFEQLKEEDAVLIAINKGANALKKFGGAQRNPQEFQDRLTARAAILNRMRQAVATQTVQQMNVQLKAANPNNLALPTKNSAIALGVEKQ